MKKDFKPLFPFQCLVPEVTKLIISKFIILTAPAL